VWQASGEKSKGGKSHGGAGLKLTVARGRMGTRPQQHYVAGAVKVYFLSSLDGWPGSRARSSLGEVTGLCAPASAGTPTISNETAGGDVASGVASMSSTVDIGGDRGGPPTASSQIC